MLSNLCFDFSCCLFDCFYFLSASIHTGKREGAVGEGRAQ